MTRETNRRTRLLVIGTSALALSISPAWAQSSSKSSAPGADQQATDDASTPRADEIVVTGTSSRQTKFDAPYYVSTVDQQRIEDTAPHSVDDLLGSIPGITIEASGGEGGGENIVIRGLPWRDRKSTRLNYSPY